jgi:cytochrome bd-type quinol oxidase subunit 2
MILYGGLAIANIARGVLAIAVAPIFADQPITLPLPLLGVIYLIWGVGFAIAVYVYWHLSKQPTRRRMPAQARRLTLGMALGYQATVWAIYLSGVRSTQARRLWTRNLLISALFLIVVILLTTTRSKIKDGGEP